MKLSLHISPCPNDTFAFDALAEAKAASGADLTAASWLVVVGFAAESAADMDALGAAVRHKLSYKGADMIVGNRIADGFVRAANRVYVADVQGREELWPEMPKPEVAWNIINWLRTLAV